MENSLISWCDNTQNFWIGCTAVSPGCLNCYADTLDLNRFSKTLSGGTKDAPIRHFGKGAPRHRTSASIWMDPFRWDKMAKNGWFRELYAEDGVTVIYRGDMRSEKCPKFEGTRNCIQVRPRVFCSSLSDILDPEVEPKMLAEALDVIRKCDGLDWLLLTKRPELWRERILAALEHATTYGTANADLFLWLNSWLNNKPPAHIWVGATMEDQPRFDKRWKDLADIPAVVRFVSMEPMLGPIDMFPVSELAIQPFHWIITGGESGADVKDSAGKVIRSPRPMHPAWARTIRDQCARLGIAFHHKQWGEWMPATSECDLITVKGGNPGGPKNPEWFTFPDGQLMARMGKRFTGRLLDGVEHDAFPISPAASKVSLQ